MSSSSQLIRIGSGKDKVLSKEQKRFNSYVNKLKKLKKETEELETFNRTFPLRLQKDLGPLEEEEARLRKELVILLDSHPLAKKLTKRQQEKLSAIIQTEAAGLISSHGMEDLKEIYDRYSDMSFEEEQKLTEDSAKQMASNMFKNMFGIDLPEDAFDDPEKAAAEMAKQMEEHQQRSQSRRQTIRKKTPAQLAREQRLAEEEKRVSQTTKSIYMELVKKFHPDQERDEEKRAWKTEVMQRVTAAYKEDNFLALLELQISLLEGKDKSLENIPDDHLKYYNKLLKNQVDELQEEYFAAHPQYNGSPYGFFFGPSYLTESRIASAVAETQTAIRQLRRILSGLNTLPDLKAFINNFRFEDEDDSLASLLFG